MQLEQGVAEKHDMMIIKGQTQTQVSERGELQVYIIIRTPNTRKSTTPSQHPICSLSISTTRTFKYIKLGI
jgi:hypothetical protein